MLLFVLGPPSCVAEPSNVGHYAQTARLNSSISTRVYRHNKPRPYDATVCGLYLARGHKVGVTQNLLGFVVSHTSQLIRPLWKATGQQEWQNLCACSFPVFSIDADEILYATEASVFVAVVLRYLPPVRGRWAHFGNFVKKALKCWLAHGFL